MTNNETFTFGSSVSVVLYAQGAPDEILIKTSTVLPYLASMNGLAAMINKLPARGFIFLYGSVDDSSASIWLGCKAWVAFDENGKVLDCETTNGKLNFSATQAMGAQMASDRDGRDI